MNVLLTKFALRLNLTGLVGLLILNQCLELSAGPTRVIQKDEHRLRTPRDRFCHGTDHNDWTEKRHRGQHTAKFVESNEGDPQLVFALFYHLRDRGYLGSSMRRYDRISRFT